MAEETREHKQNVQKCRIQLLFISSRWFSYSTTTVAVWPWSLKEIRACAACVLRTPSQDLILDVVLLWQMKTRPPAPLLSLLSADWHHFTPALHLSPVHPSNLPTCCCHSNPTTPFPLLTVAEWSMLGNLTSPGTFLLWDFFVLVPFLYLKFWFPVWESSYLIRAAMSQKSRQTGVIT